jgi:hypothetical protein
VGDDASPPASAAAKPEGNESAREAAARQPLMVPTPTAVGVGTMPFTIDFEPLQSGMSMTLVLVIATTLLGVVFVLLHGGAPRGAEARCSPMGGRAGGGRAVRRPAGGAPIRLRPRL